MANVIAPLQVATAPKAKRHFIGRAWVNTARTGKQFINVKLDRSVQLQQVDETCTLQLWENMKRPGKKDADYRLSILIPQTA